MASAAQQAVGMERVNQAIRNIEQVAVSASYELDLWGRVRRSTEAARATLLATKYAQRTVTTALIANVADAYFNLQSLDAQLEITQRTVDSREKFVALTRGAQRAGPEEIEHNPRSASVRLRALEKVGG